MTFDAGTVVRLPFPYTDRPVRQNRPALVISDGPLGPDGGQIWVMMITSAANRGWPGDVAIAENLDDAGLPVASVIRTAKMATIDTGQAEAIGHVGAGVLQQVRNQCATILGLRAR